MTTQLKQLKKSDYLSAITEEPMDRRQVVEALEDFSFIGSYLDYLQEHFVAQGKIIENEDGTIQRAASKSAAKTRVMYRVADTDDVGLVLQAMEVTGNLTDEEKREGWSVTEQAAVKKACAAVFHEYKQRTSDIKELLSNKS